MNLIYYLTFITIVIVVGWILRPVEEHMTIGSSKHEIYGPKGVDAEKCARVYPQVYGPDGVNLQNHQQNGLPSGTLNEVISSRQSQLRTTSGQTQSVAGGGDYDVEYPSATTAMYEDDGEFRSDTATRNAAYMNVFTIQPYAKMDFPTSGPPGPYLTDFAKFHN